jgi:meso-butanediol dehydrogenase / (S,S)-butanediol dehydrogenase / diacetyl reductase
MRSVIVTGGAYGIGRAIVKRLAADEASVVVADINEQRGRELAGATRGTEFFQTDVRDEKQIEALVEFTLKRFGRLDVVICNAGIERYKRADEYTTEDWTAIIDTNLRASFLLAKQAYPHLRESRGCIVFISSVQAFANERNISIYGSSKSGLMGLMRGMALDFAADGVRVNAVCPGATMTGMMEAALASERDPEATLKALSAAIPLGRIGQPEDIANAVAFLSSEQASFITGTYLVVDGGTLAKLAL